MYQDEDDLLSFEGFYELHSSHWKIEQYHRVIKQVCHIEKFQFITGDSWYSSTANLKTIRKHGIRFMFGIDCNRKVSLKKDNGFNCVYCRISIRVKWSGSKILALYRTLRYKRTSLRGSLKMYIVGRRNYLDQLSKTSLMTLFSIKIICYHRESISNSA